ncbi:MAG: hypothetical protein ACREBY_12025 [Polaromonas sp.]
MPDVQSRETPWRQGLVLEHQAALALGLTATEGPDQTVVVVVSHDCDIANAPEREPMVEVVVGRRIAALGADTHAKTARRLHLEFETDEGPVAVELVATDKVAHPKDAVLSTQPRTDWLLTPEGLVTLQQWLAARYRRSAFADEFERRLKDKPARLDGKIAKALDAPSAHVLAILFDVDDGAEKHRIGPDDVYQLRITLLYDSTTDEPAAYAAAQKAADTIEDAFEKAFLQGEAWKNIQLLSCTPVSDSVMTVAESRLLKQWRLDYMSLGDDPQQAMFEE